MTVTEHRGAGFVVLSQEEALKLAHALIHRVLFHPETGPYELFDDGGNLRLTVAVNCLEPRRIPKT